jgi:hypothetical protein
MKKYFFITLCIIGFMSISIAQVENNPKIQSTKGFLYYNTSNEGMKSMGTLSENIIDNPEFALWNALIGEGSAKGSSKNTLIKITIKNESKQGTSKCFIRLIVTNKNNEIIFSQIQGISYLSINESYSAPFLLYDTGCGLIKLKAELLDETKTKVLSKIEKEINYQCGE